MKISELEHKKQIGALSLDHLKKRNKANQADDKYQSNYSSAAGKGGDAGNNYQLPPVEIGGKKALKPVQPLPPTHIRKEA